MNGKHGHERRSGGTWVMWDKDGKPRQVTGKPEPLEPLVVEREERPVTVDPREPRMDIKSRTVELGEIGFGGVAVIKRVLDAVR